MKKILFLLFTLNLSVACVEVLDKTPLDEITEVTYWTSSSDLQLYLNKIFLGHRSYGIAAAADFYYGKTLDQLGLTECAMLAALPKFPSTGNPINRPDRAMERRNYVLDRMLEVGYIDAATHAEAIALPDHAYKERTPECPFGFEISEHSRLQWTESENPDEKCWFGIVYPRYGAHVYITYKEIQGDDLRTYIEESRTLVYEHQIKANRILMEEITRDSANVYGLTYDLGGEVASPYQFYLTDSTRHFLRGSLYFNSRPNPDSIAPVLDYVRKDMEHFAETLYWR